MGTPLAGCREMMNSAIEQNRLSGREGGRSRLEGTLALSAVLLVAVIVGAVPASAAGEQASDPGSSAAGKLDGGGNHTCAILVDGTVRCWGYGGEGQLGYGNTDSIGDDETPGSVGPVNLGPGRTATAIATGDFHTCVLLDDGSVRCWGFGGDGRLGYGNTSNVGDTPTTTPDKVGPVNLGPGRTAKAITAGAGHTCALLDNGSVRCWGYNGNGRLGYGNTNNVGDTPTMTPDKAGPVDLGLGRTAKAISAGSGHTCALLDDGSVRCWGFARDGELGYGNLAIGADIGDDETPGSVGPVNLGPGHTATAITAGGRHTCAVLDDSTVRCWGYAGAGQLGYGNTNNVGETPTTTPDKVGPVNLGPGRTARAISAGLNHTCALLDDGAARCWGYGLDGRLGYGNTSNVGDTPAMTPDKMGPVDLGPGRTATAISAGSLHTCALLDDTSVRCWGYGANGRLGYCNQDNVGDIQTPGVVGPVALEPGGAGAGCASSPGVAPATPPGTAAGPTVHGGRSMAPRSASDAQRARGLRACLAVVARQARRERRLARRRSARWRATVRLHIERQASSGRRRCLRRYTRTPGRITGLHARALSRTAIELSFNAPGTKGSHPPAARTYLIKQSLRPMRRALDFARAQTLCKGHCHFTVTRVGAKITLTITGLRPHTTYYYAIAARDNVSARGGPRSQTVRATTR